MRGADLPPIAVVVATYDRPDFLADCLASVAASLSVGDELVVAEAGDSHAAVVLSRLGRPGTVVPVAPPGKSRQLNAAVARTTAPVVLFTDDDCRVDPAWAAGLVQALDDPRVGIAFGPVRGLTHVPGGEEVIAQATGEAPITTWTFAHGASFAVRRAALVAIGGFDERLGPGAPAHGEEHDVLLRLRERGWRAVIAGTPVVVHLGWRTSAESRANALVYERGSGAFLGAALRRNPRRTWPLLKQRLGYQRQLLADRRAGDDAPFGRQALRAFGGGLAYGLRLRPWPPGPAVSGLGGPPDAPAL